MTIHPPKPAKHKRASAPVGDAPQGRVWGYVRVSTTQQCEVGESLDVQARTIAGYAMQHSMTIEKVFVERGVSASKPLSDRPEGSALMAALLPGDSIVAPKLDRLFRSALDALQTLQKLKAANISVHLLDLGGNVTDNGVAKAFFTMASAFAELERDRTRERITEVKRDQRQRGRFLGGTAPFGWRKGKDGALVPVARQQAAIARMQALRAKGASFRAISEALRVDDGIRLSHVGVMHALATTVAP